LGTQVLTATSITQDGGKTVLKYTQPLVDAGDDAVIKAGQAVRFIWAQGRFNFLGYHQRRGVGATTIANCTSA
jgi:hypothetical protein